MAIFDKIGEGTRALSGKHHRTAAVIVAGGSGSRMMQESLIDRIGKIVKSVKKPSEEAEKTEKSEQNVPTKQFLELCGKPMVVYSLLAFEESEYIDEIVIVAKKGEQPLYPELIEKYGITKVHAVVTGGETRQESVWNGFSAISDRCDFVAIHDAARPLVTPALIKKVMLAGFDCRAASAAAPAKDTPKTVNLSGFVEQTHDRSKLWLVQTPQVFYANLYRASAVTAEKDKFKATDDCSIAEHAGFSVKLVDTGYANLKVTTPEDLLYAEAILRNRENKENG